MPYSPLPITAAGSNKVFIERLLKKLRLSSVCDMISKIKNATGIPAPRAMEFLDRLKIQEQEKEILLVANSCV